MREREGVPSALQRAGPLIKDSSDGLERVAVLHQRPRFIARHIYANAVLEREVGIQQQLVSNQGLGKPAHRLFLRVGENAGPGVGERVDQDVGVSNHAISLGPRTGDVKGVVVEHRRSSTQQVGREARL